MIKFVDMVTLQAIWYHGIQMILFVVWQYYTLLLLWILSDSVL